MKERRNYVNNASLLREIHNSKLTYCYYEEEKYSDYDIICDGYDLITPNQVESFFNKNKNRDYIIIRVMTSEHCLDVLKDNKINLQELKFSPFKHIKISREAHNKVINLIDPNCFANIELLNQNISSLKDEIKENKNHIRFLKNDKDGQTPYKDSNIILKQKVDELKSRIKEIAKNYSHNIRNEAVEVLRSHWSGGFENGHFDISKGKITNNLVQMIMLMVDQYGTSGNWAGYSYIEDMKSSALVHLVDVALKFEELKSDNPFAYYTQVIAMKFTATVNAEKQQAKIKSDLLQAKGYMPTYGEQAENDIAIWNDNNQ